MRTWLLQHIEGFIAAFVCMIIWNLGGYLLTEAYKTWPCSLFTAYSNAWFLSLHLVIGWLRTRNDKDLKQKRAKVLKKSALVKSAISSLIFFASHICWSICFKVTKPNATHLVIATVQLCSVHTLWLDWMFNGKSPRFINIMGCILLVSGVFAFNFVGQYFIESASKESFQMSMLWQPGFLWSNLSVLFFAAYQYCHESVLNDIPEEYVLGVLGVNMILFGWIPSFIAHFMHFETLSLPSLNVALIIVIFGCTNIIADYCVMFAVRKTSAFVLSGTLALGSPVALAMTFIKNKIERIEDDVWTWWYLPTLVFILIGCILVYYGDAETEQGDEENKTTETNVNDQITLNETNAGEVNDDLKT